MQILNTALKNTLLDALTATITGCKLYNSSNELLVTLPMTFQSAVDGIAAMTGSATAMPVAAGTHSYGIFINALNEPLAQSPGTIFTISPIMLGREVRLNRGQLSL